VVEAAPSSPKLTMSPQYFHVLRRQMHRPFRKPLIVMTPKSLLRHERCTSPLEDFTAGGFRLVLDDAAGAAAERIQRVVLCSGKIYFDLLKGREARGVDGIALVRVEQLYPLPQAELQEVLARYRKAEDVMWVQEEPRNMGAWSFMEPRLQQLLPSDRVLTYGGRPEAASPATGSHRHHAGEQEELIKQALGLAPVGVSTWDHPEIRARRSGGRDHGDGYQR
jgi:2-oxoglutarate dehydrogenase complex dehydrogenase (E1) component-like enzyme